MKRKKNDREEEKEKIMKKQHKKKQRKTELQKYRNTERKRSIFRCVVQTNIPQPVFRDEKMVVGTRDEKMWFVGSKKFCRALMLTKIQCRQQRMKSARQSLNWS